MYIVYALYSEKFDKIYIGFTSDLIERFKAHNELSKKGWTKSFRPWIIIYEEEHLLKSDAMKREKQLKSASGRDFVRSLIKNKN
jgi:putative endonuclease